MKHSHPLIALMALIVLPVCAAPTTSNPGPSLDATPPNISEAAARARALAAVPNGKIQSAELEIENGRRVWSFDIEQRGKKAVTEILVDAATGRIVSKRNESPNEQAKEAAAEKHRR